MKNLAIIPARSGSKGLPNKNIKHLDKKPLINYSIEAALQSAVFDEVMVSTDSEKYAEIAVSAGAKVPFLRSEVNSSDQASSWDVVREILKEYRERMQTYDTVCLLQPTSPLRIADDIVQAYEMYKNKKANAVIGVCEVDHSPLWTNTLTDTLSMDNFLQKDSILPRQKLDLYYRINGAIYIVNTRCVERKKNIFNNSFAYIMPRERSVDIDTELDFLLAETIRRYDNR